MYQDDATTKHRRGEDHPGATLTNADARAIYQAWQQRRREYGIQTRLARTYGVSQTTVHSIVHRRSWRAATQEED
jgi:hypothetical protein